MKNVLNFIGEFAAMFAAIATIFLAVSAFAQYCHRHNGECGGENGCKWAWCKHYDGSDYLHDFNF